jgi:hypothetical protein
MNTLEVHRMSIASIMPHFTVLTAVLLKLQIFCDVTPCRLVNDCRRFEEQSKCSVCP